MKLQKKRTQEQKLRRLRKLDKIKPSVFRWTDDQSGVIAQEVGLAYPETLSMAYSTTIPTGGYTIPVGGLGAGVGGLTGSYTISTGAISGGYSTSSNVNITSNGIDMAAGTDIRVDGKSLKQFMDKMEERLAILVPDPAKLEKFEALKKAYENYKLMERLCQIDDQETK